MDFPVRCCFWVLVAPSARPLRLLCYTGVSLEFVAPATSKPRNSPSTQGQMNIFGLPILISHCLHMHSSLAGICAGHRRFFSGSKMPLGSLAGCCHPTTKRPRCTSFVSSLKASLKASWGRCASLRARILVHAASLISITMLTLLTASGSLKPTCCVLKLEGCSVGHVLVQSASVPFSRCRWRREALLQGQTKPTTAQTHGDEQCCVDEDYRMSQAAPRQVDCQQGREVGPGSQRTEPRGRID